MWFDLQHTPWPSTKPCGCVKCDQMPGAFNVWEKHTPANREEKVKEDPVKYVLYQIVEDGCMACLQYTLHSHDLLLKSKDLRSCDLNLADYALWKAQKKIYPAEERANCAIIGAWLLTKWADETKRANGASIAAWLLTKPADKTGDADVGAAIP